MSTVLNLIIRISLFIHVLLMGVALWRVWQGENVIDRMMAVDLLSTLTLAVLVLTALVFRERIYIDAALGLAALGFIGMVAFARYISDDRMY